MATVKPRSAKPNGPSTVFESSSGADAYVQQKIDEILDRSAFRKKTLEIIEEHTSTVPFMKRVQEYADEQIDRRLFKNTKVAAGLFVGWVASIVVAVIIAKIT